ncbi:hypothetical protein BDP27DRAFT_1397530 [Rhodocollybia butyracea]|uniref:Uncharacterized protein n=1 Tax=Rhodocollybia butyracea TaxID=206335 RepID=A0A9P5UFZ4_9AGAR|nr:hypothetical protein BDP27DRAFT_1397530 [Rhodocollybia butyracea]
MSQCLAAIQVAPLYKLQKFKSGFSAYFVDLYYLHPSNIQSQMSYRERRSWTEEEDQLLRDAVDLEEPGSINPSKWHAISKHVPNRTNKDCRKRWFAKMASDVVKGGWAPEEDEKLVKGIEKYGTRWSLVSAYVQTRNSDQCAKRWTDTLNPMIDRTRWSTEADALLLNAVEEHGKLWTKIVRIYFPGRTGLAAKNRYNSITRFNTRAPRRKSYKPRSQSESSSSTVSSSPSIISSRSSTGPDTPEQSTPPSPSLAEPPLQIPHETWSPAESSCGSASLSSLSSTTLTYEELCDVMLSATGVMAGVGGIPDYGELQSSAILSSPQDSSSLFPWESMDGTYSQLQHAISLCSDAPLSLSPSSDSFFPYQSSDPDFNAISPTTSDTSSILANTCPSQNDEEVMAKSKQTDADALSLCGNNDNDYKRTTVPSNPFWEMSSSDPQLFLAQWSNTF